MKQRFKTLTLPLLTAMCAASAQASEPADTWLEQGKAELRQSLKLKPTARKAKNVILFVGDGMGVSTVTAARILQGQLRGESGEENSLSFELLPYLGLAKTYNTNQQTPDSAGTMTAMMTGVKTKAGVISVDESVQRGDCASSKGAELGTFLEEMEQAGRSTGVVTTARLTHATPAATYAHSPERNWEDVSDMPAEAVQAGCKDIARQLIEFPYGDGVDVAMGGGRRHFLPKDAAYNSGDQVSSVEGDRTDGRFLPGEWMQATGGTYVIDQAGFDAVDTESTRKLLGLFNESHMHYESDRATDILGEPSLAEMTGKAIDILNNNPKGYFLMVEAGRIDHAHHAGNAHNALQDTIAFSDAVAEAMKKVDPKDTLILVTADHSHVFTIAGYPTRGNPILGKVVTNDSAGNSKGVPQLANDGLPYTTLGYTNGRGFADLGAETDADVVYGMTPMNGRADLSGVDTTAPGFHQEALIPLGSETHAGEDVAVYAGGPFAQLIRHTAEQSYLFQVMEHAVNLRKGSWEADRERRSDEDL